MYGVALQYLYLAAAIAVADLNKGAFYNLASRGFFSLGALLRRLEAGLGAGFLRATRGFGVVEGGTIDGSIGRLRRRVVIGGGRVVSRGIVGVDSEVRRRRDGR